MIFLAILGETEMSCRSRLVLEGKTGKDIFESSRLDFLEKFLTKEKFNGLEVLSSVSEATPC